MARIPEAEIERLKNEVSVERLVEAAGVALKKSGKDLLGVCPFHEDGEPSLVVTPAKNLWHCFGCQVGGGPIDWVMKRQGVSFRHAVELLREGLPSLAAAGAVEPARRTLSAPVRFDADDQTLLNETIAYYHERLQQAPEALAYLRARGIDDADAIARFQLGFADRTLGLRLPGKANAAGQAIRSRLQALGLLRESGHEHFNGSLVIPIHDEAGHVVEVYGRKITVALRAGTPKHLYLPGPHRGVWNREALAASPEVILCEALIDALTFWCAGFRNVTASYGVEGFTAEHLAAFEQFGTRRVLIAYDRDEAGEKAALKLAGELAGHGIECRRIQFPRGLDANEYALKVAPAAKSLGLAIAQAVPCGPDAGALAPLPRSRRSATTEAPAPAASAPVIPEVAVPPPVAASEPPHPEPPPPPPSAPGPEAVAPVPAANPAPGSEAPRAAPDNEHHFAFGDRRYRVRGLAKNLAYEVMKVNVMVSLGERFHVDTFDLYAARARAGYLAQAALELQVKEDILKADLGRVLLALEARQEEAIQSALKPPAPAVPEMSEAERAAALDLLRAPT